MLKNFLGNRLACVATVVDKMEYNAKRDVVQEKIEEAKEVILDGGAEIASYLGEIMQKIDELYPENVKND